MARLRGSRFPRTGARHRSSWGVGPATTAGGAGQSLVSSTADLGGTAVSVGLDNLTLIRTRGEFVAFLKTSASDANGFHGAFGIAKATSAAILAGVASVPTPITEQDWEGWLYHRYFSIFSGGPIAAATAAQEALQVNNVCAALRIEVDSKAMRKSDIDEGFYCAVEIVEVGTATMSWTFNSRMLFKDMG